MRNRSLLALYTAFCLLVSLIAVPSGPQLVCQMTGMPVYPVAAKGAKKRPSCCDVAAFLTADGTPRYRLTHPGCCDLRQGIDRLSAPAVRTASAEIPPAILTAPPLAAPLPEIADAPLQAERPRSLAPRPPPRSSPASPRAPPFLS